MRRYGRTREIGPGQESSLKYVFLFLAFAALPVQSAAANNPYGVHMLSFGSNIQDWAQSLTGPGGYCKQLFMGITNSKSGPDPGWVSFVQGCYNRQMIPVCRLATNYSGGQWTAPVPDAPGDYTSFAQAVKRVVQGLPRSDTYPLYIELLNEVNSGKEWGGSANAWEYANCLVDCAAAVRSIGDSRIRMMNAGLAGGAGFIDEMFTLVPESLWAFDVYAVHCYSLNRPPEINRHNGTAGPGDICIDSYFDDLAVIAAHGRTGVQVMLTETGYALGDQSFANYPIINEDNRADYIVRAFRDYWSKWPEVLAVTPFEFLDNGGGWTSYDWVYASSGTGAMNRPTNAHKQYYDVWNLAKPNMTRGGISGYVAEAAYGSRLAGATVTLNPGGYTTTTDAMGNYYFPNSANLTLVSPGAYSLTASKTGFANQTMPSVSVVAAQNTVVNFSLPASGTGSIAGRVTDPYSGEGIQGVSISISPGGSTAVTDSAGDYLVQGLTPSTYNVSAAKSRYRSFTHVGLVVAANDTSVLDLRLAPGSDPPYANMLQNTDLEYGGGASGDGVASGWANVYNQPRPDNFAIDTAVSFSGRASQRITPNGTDAYWVGQWTGYGTIHPYTRYKFQAWCKTSSPSGTGAQVVAVLSHYGESIDAIVQAYPVVTTDTGWTLMQGYVTVPNLWGGDSGRMRLELHGARNGTTWFDRCYVGLDDRSDSPVSPPSSLAATPGQGSITLSWITPPNPPYALINGTTIVYRTDRYPTTRTDGTVLADVPGTPNSTGNAVHSGLTAGVRHYYAAFAHTSGPANFSDPSFATAKAFDGTAPTVPVVVDDGTYTRSSTVLHASWSASDPESGIAAYEYAIGVTPLGTELVGWTGVGLATQVTRPGLALANGQTYYISVRATNGVGLTSIGSSDGIRVASPATTIAAARALADGTFVWLEDKIVTAGNDLLLDVLQIQEEDRTAGISVDVVSGLFSAGSRVDVAGHMGTADGARVIQNASVAVHEP